MSALIPTKKESSNSRFVTKAIAALPVILFIYSILLQTSSTPFDADIDLGSYEKQSSGIPNPDENSPERPQKDTNKEVFKQQLTKDLRIPTKAEFVEAINLTRIAITTTTAGSVESTKLWMKYHTAIGVSNFYLFTNDQANHEDARKELLKWAGVKVFPHDRKLESMKANSRTWNESWLSAFFNKPCNHELFVMQSLNMEVAIKQARKDNVDWLIHLDTDELFYPAGTLAYNIQQFFAGLDDSVDTVVFPNYEALPEHENYTEPFLEASLFKRNFAHVKSDQYFKYYGTIAKGNPNYFVAYGNGKSAAKIQPGLRPNGAHRWYFYTKRPKEYPAEQAAILHYVYNKYSDLKGRRDRCDCAPTEEDTRRCFMLPFDREAFIKSSLLTDTQLRKYFQDHLIWSNKSVNFEMIRNGLLIREHTPQTLMRLFKQLPDYGLTLAPPEESKMTVQDEYVIPE